MKILAFDYGASSGRSILGEFDGNKLGLRETHRFGSDPVMMNGTFTWDFPRLFHEMKRGIVNTVNGGDRDIASIGIDTWGVDFGLLSKNGKLLGNPVHYRDARTDGMIERACEIVPAKEIYKTTGIAFQKFNSLYQLLAMKCENDPVLEMADTFLFIPDLFNYFLTGKKFCEYTITSTSQMYDPRKGDWARGMLKKLGIRSDFLPEVIPAGTKLGGLTKEIQEELGVGEIPVIAVAEHDTGSAVMSVPYVEKGAAFLSSGTWSLLGIELDKPLINETVRKLNYTNEGGYGNNVRLLKNIMGLWINNECMRDWEKKGEKISYAEMNAGVEAAEPFIAVIDVDHPDFFDPFNMPEKIRDYCRRTGQRVPETKGEIIRVVEESLALKYRQCIEGLEEIIGKPVPALNIVGGGTKNTILSRFTANAIGRTVYAGPVEATAIGNLCCQLIALGEVSGIDQAREVVRNSFPIEIYQPEDTGRWEEAYGKLLALQAREAR